MIEALTDYLLDNFGVILSALVGTLIIVVLWFISTHNCARYETYVKDTYPVFVKIGYVMMPIGGGRREVTECVEWKNK